MRATASPTLEDWAVARDLAMTQVSENAGPDFKMQATAFVVAYLTEHGPTSGEDLTDAAKAAGIVPGNTDRAFGGIYGGLVHRKVIERHSFCIRRKGHLTAGGSVWQLVNAEKL